MQRLVDTLRARLAVRRRNVADFPHFRPAAVLVPLVDRAGEPHLLFTLRSAALPVHSGQVSFPGGKSDRDDHDRVATALRELEEELGIGAEKVEVLGLLDDVATPSGFVITPVVGLVRVEEASYRPAQAEVAEVFEIPLSALDDPEVFEDLGDVEREGRNYRLCAFKVEGRNIWGATARMVRQLLDIR
jgi:8-oxo-dGTP pyrophosphatase MutT (NUDIX family)